MSMKMMNAAYLVDNAALLSLQEKQDGVEFHCFDMDSKVQIAEDTLAGMCWINSRFLRWKKARGWQHSRRFPSWTVLPLRR